MSKSNCSFQFQGHYVNRQIFPNGIYKIMVWVKSNPPEEELCADVVTRKGNMAHAAALGRMEKGSDRHNAKLKESDIPEIRSRLALGHSQRKIARDYSVHQRVIWLIANDKSWRHA